MKKLLFSILLVLLPTLANADITWQFDELTGTLTISGTGNMDDYYYNSNTHLTTAPWKDLYIRIKQVEIENGITSIGSYAFYDCSLTSVIIPNSVTTIGRSAFEGCGLTTVTIPNSVTTIGKSAFADCGLTTVTIPNSVTSIGNSAFYSCSRLTSVTIGNSVTIIEESSFEDCNSLATITIPNSVTNIRYKAFYNCFCLTTVTIPNSVTSIGGSAFSGCYRLNTIYCLNPTPPTCGLKTFYCNESVRDGYDVYSYAVLRVPMGSEEVYGAAYEWRYFNKIKGDMESGGRVHYANLIVQQGTTGYTRQAVKAAEKYTIYIGSLGENKVNAVAFNGVDVTDEVVNGYYTTPEIKGESVLSISFETNTSAVSARLNNVRVTGYKGEINIHHIDEPSDVSVYSADGELVGSVPAAFDSVTLRVPEEQLYIVIVGTRTYKVAL